jgi:hypothetical protein
MHIPARKTTERVGRKVSKDITSKDASLLDSVFGGEVLRAGVGNY